MCYPPFLKTHFLGENPRFWAKLRMGSPAVFCKKVVEGVTPGAGGAANPPPPPLGDRRNQETAFFTAHSLADVRGVPTEGRGRAKPTRTETAPQPRRKPHRGQNNAIRARLNKTIQNTKETFCGAFERAF